MTDPKPSPLDAWLVLTVAVLCACISVLAITTTIYLIGRMF